MGRDDGGTLGARVAPVGGGALLLSGQDQVSAGRRAHVVAAAREPSAQRRRFPPSGGQRHPTSPADNLLRWRSSSCVGCRFFFGPHSRDGPRAPTIAVCTVRTASAPSTESATCTPSQSSTPRGAPGKPRSPYTSPLRTYSRAATSRCWTLTRRVRPPGGVSGADPRRRWYWQQRQAGLVPSGSGSPAPVRTWCTSTHRLDGWVPTPRPGWRPAQPTSWWCRCGRPSWTLKQPCGNAGAHTGRHRGSGVVAVLNGCATMGSDADDAEQALADRGVEVCPVRIGQRVVFARSLHTGQVAQELEPTGKAAAEIARVHAVLSVHSMHSRGTP